MYEVDAGIAISASSDNAGWGYNSATATDSSVDALALPIKAGFDIRFTPSDPANKLYRTASSEYDLTVFESPMCLPRPCRAPWMAASPLLADARLCVRAGHPRCLLLHRRHNKNKK